MVGGAIEYPGRWVRVCICALTGFAVVSSAVTLPSRPTELTTVELVGLVLAGSAGYLFLVGVGPVGLCKSRRSFATPVLIALTLTSAPQVTVLAWIVIAIVSGLWIRRHRFTPGGMAIGASMITLGAWAGAWTIHALDRLPVLVAAVAGLVAYRVVSHLVYITNFSTALREPVMTHLRNWDITEDAGRELAGLSLGLAAVVLREQASAGLLLLALPYAATIVASLQRLLLQHVNRRDRAMATLGHRLQAASTLEEIEGLMIDAAEAVLDAPSARVGASAPGNHELGVRWRDGWLVAEDRRRPPTFNRPYRAAERAELDAIVTAASAAVENLALLERLERLSMEDELTGLLNRRGAEQAFEAALAEARRHVSGVAVQLLDIDGFKAINDTYGHPVGDLVLAEIARRLRSATRAGETVARWGGEEFLALVPCEPDDGARVAERLRSAGSGVLDVDGRAIDVTLSCGVAVARPSDALDAGALVGQADQALYQAKTRGKNRTEVHAVESSLHAS